MAQFTLKRGLPYGKDENAVMQMDVTLRELTGGDMIEAEVASEKMVMTPKGPVLLSSSAIMGFELLRRSVARVGEIQGPLSMDQLKSLSAEDLALLLDHSNMNSSAAINTVQGVIAEGR